MISGEIIQGKLTTTIEADVLIAPEKKPIFEWWVESIFMDLAVACNDAGQSQHGLLTAAIYTSTHLEDSATEGPDDEVFHQQCCCLFSGKPTNRNTRFVQP